MKQLLTIVPRIAAEWDKVAYCLNFASGNIINIQTQYGDDPEKCCCKLLEEWISSDRGSTPKSWTTLLSVFKQIKTLSETGRKIEKDLKM